MEDLELAITYSLIDKNELIERLIKTEKLMTSEKAEKLIEKTTSSISPSTLGKEEEFLKTYENQGIYCNVPPGAWQTHPSLYFEPFSLFSRITSIPDDEYMELVELASTFVYSMTKSYVSEQERLTEVKKILTHWFPNYKIFSTGTKNFQTDVTFFQKKRKFNTPQLVLANIEIKNGLGQTNTDANLQNVHYYNHLTPQQKGINPLLLISLVGRDYLQAFGAVRTESNHVSCSPLCPPLSMLFEHRITTTIDSMIIFWYKVKCLLEQLDKYYCEGTEIIYPYFFNNTFTNIKQISAGIYQCFLDDKKVIVKFTVSYGIEVHQYMHQAGFAPEVIKFTNLGNWNAVVMEYVHGTKVETEVEIQECKDFIKQHILPELQKNNYVHGDLRLANIIKRHNNFILIDYDWADKDGVAHFPVNLNFKLTWPESVRAGGRITKQTDIDTVEILEKLL